MWNNCYLLISIKPVKINTMKSIKYIFISTVLALLLFNACEKFIDLKPLDQISTSDYWKTTTDLKNYVSQFYPKILPPAILTGVSGTIFDNKSDNIIIEAADAVMNGERIRSTGIWRGEWVPIRELNIFFENYRKCENSFDAYKHYVGEAHFFRAWWYFDLLNKYGDLPWYSKTIELDSEEDLMKARDPRTLIADSILADLDKAILYLDKRSKAVNSRINK